MTSQLEHALEDYLIEEVKARGGLALKILPASFVGLPDRLVLLPNGRVGFIELKRAGLEPTAIQRYWQKRILELDILCVYVDSQIGVDTVLEELAR